MRRHALAPEVGGDVGLAEIRMRAERMAEAFQGREEVAALFLGGSLASHTADDHSDIDLYVVAHDGRLEAVLGYSREVLASVGRLVFWKRVDHGFPLEVFVYADGIRGEVGYGTPRSLDDLHYGPYVVLFDPEGLLIGHVFPGWRDPAERKRELAGSLEWFWREALLARAYLCRGDLWSAAAQIEGLRRRLAGILRSRRPGGGDPEEGLSKLGRYVPDGELGALKESFFRFDPREMEKALQGLCSLAWDLGRGSLEGPTQENVAILRALALGEASDRPGPEMA
ncbi:MAG: hypothetical protein QME93_08525 [Bacillota bacterium]|nr:hypothetical protein [Bacillota bacterium]